MGWGVGSPFGSAVLLTTRSCGDWSVLDRSGVDGGGGRFFGGSRSRGVLPRVFCLCPGNTSSRTSGGGVRFGVLGRRGVVLRVLSEE